MKNQIDNNTVFQCMQTLERIPDKSEWKTTTSKVFKVNLAQFFNKKEKQDWIELGAAQGHTTLFISGLANKVLSIDYDEKNCEDIDKLALPNVETSTADLYSRQFQDFMQNSKFDVAVIDAIHDEEHVKIDISNCINAGIKTFIFDDYGMFPGVKNAIDGFINSLDDPKINYIGMSPGTRYPNTQNKVLQDWEGIIVEIK
jgi:hypothetical protein